MGHTNAAASTMAVVFSGKLDLSQAYFLVTGISGIDPNVGTIGAATWARYDRPHDGQSAFESLNTRSGGFPAATANLFVVGSPLVQEIVTHWDSWKDGVPRD